MTTNFRGLIGDTPLIEIDYQLDGAKKKAFFKAEWYNLTGSIKDRVAKRVLLRAMKKMLKSGQPVVEVTSGNMGISLSAICNLLQRKMVAIMPKYMSQERKALLKSFGATVVESESFQHAFNLLEDCVKEGMFCPRQFENVENKLCHKETTAKEIVRQTKGEIGCFVAGVGTAGTLMGVGECLLEKTPKAQLVAVEPSNSPLFSKGVSGKHQLQGLADEKIPLLYDKSIVDKVVSVNDQDAIAMAQKLAKTFGLGVGISSGANFVAVVKNGVDNAVSIFADDNKKYLTTSLATPIETPLVDKIQLLNFKAIK